jgi:membrane-bound lytic murein transglycosylase D
MKRWTVIPVLLGLAAVTGCATPGGTGRFEPMSVARLDRDTLEVAGPRTATELLQAAEEAFREANEAQEAGDQEAALRHYNTMLELLVDADLDPQVFYSLREEFTRILDETSVHARHVDPHRPRDIEWPEQLRADAEGGLPIPDPLPERVIREIAKIQESYPRGFQYGLNRSAKYLPYIRAEFRKAGLPEELAWLAMVESQFTPKITSRAGAGGMWQFMKGTGRRYGLKVDSEIDERYNWEKSTRAAIAYLTDLRDMFDGNWPLAITAYNMGEYGLERAVASNGGDTNLWTLIETAPAANHIRLESKEFYPKLLASIIVASDPEAYGFRLEPKAPDRTVRMAVNGPYELNALEQALKLERGTLARLNPDLIRGHTPTDGSHKLCVPEEVADRFMAAVAATEKYTVRYATDGSGNYVVRRGDTIGKLAQRFGTSVETIRRANKLRSANHIRVGQRLHIPGAGGTVVTASGGATYQVRPGDTLSEIAVAHKVSLAELRAWNGLSSSRIRVGQTLTVAKAGGAAPGQGRKIVHTVSAGEYPSRIASKYGVKTNDLLAWNGLGRNSMIRVGDKLTLYTADAEPEVRQASASSGGGGPRTFKVARGESPWTIARKHGVGLDEFLEWNGLTRRSVLKVGQSYVVYTGGGADAQISAAEREVHRVRRGENPWVIARRYGVDTNDLFRWNGWQRGKVLRIGEEVVILK